MRNIKLEKGKSIRIETLTGFVTVRAFDNGRTRVETSTNYREESQIFFQIPPKDLLNSHWTKDSQFMKDEHCFVLEQRRVGSISIQEKDDSPFLSELFEDFLNGKRRSKLAVDKDGCHVDGAGNCISPGPCVHTPAPKAGGQK